VVIAMKKWMIALALLAIAAAVPLACMLAENLSAPAPGDGSVLLVEHMKQTRGRLVNGTYPAETLGGTEYQYDAFSRQMDVSGLQANDSLRVVLGVTEGLSQDAGSGTAGTVYGIYEIPASAGDVAVEGLAPDGTVTLAYNGSRIVLAPGERWETISTEVACTPEYSIRYTRSDMIRNQGFVDKDAVG
jgi:hypothetical protein